MDNNVYLIAVGDEAAVVDGGSSEVDAVLSELGDRKLVSVLQTHNHGDHVAELPKLVEKTKVPVLAHPADADKIPVPIEKLDDGATVGLGGCLFKVLHTPGHTPGHCAFRIAADAVCCSGDLVFAGSIGRSDFANSDPAAMEGSLRRFLELADEVSVLPGHGPRTSVGRERASNPFLQGLR